MGAVNFVVGSEGCDYTSPAGKEYKLTGWTLEVIARHERYLEQRAENALAKMSIPQELKAEAYKELAFDIGSKFTCSYGSDIWDSSLKSLQGLAHLFSLLTGCKLAEATELLLSDDLSVQEAIFKANPRYRATAETPKAE